MKNNIKQASVKFWEDLLYFQHFMQIFVFAQNQWLSPPKDYGAYKMASLTHSHLETRKRIIRKHCRPRSDAT